MFKNIRQRSKLDSKVSSLQGLITYSDMKIQTRKKLLQNLQEKTVNELTDAEMAKITQDVDVKMGSSIFQSELKNV